MGYTEEEKREIIYFFYKNNKNASAAQADYRVSHAGMPVPSRGTFYNIERHFRIHKNLQRKKRFVRINEDEELEILLYFQGKQLIRTLNFVKLI